MIVFIDESGIHKTTDHSTFALVYVETKNRELLEQEVKKIEKQIKVEEFHWRNQPWKLRRAFIEKAVRLPFTAKVAIFRNPIIPSEAFECALQHTLVGKIVRNF